MTCRQNSYCPRLYKYILCLFISDTKLLQWLVVRRAVPRLVRIIILFFQSINTHNGTELLPRAYYGFFVLIFKLTKEELYKFTPLAGLSSYFCNPK